jgi:hypothetical protein
MVADGVNLLPTWRLQLLLYSDFEALQQLISSIPLRGRDKQLLVVLPAQLVLDLHLKLRPVHCQRLH